MRPARFACALALSVAPMTASAQRVPRWSFGAEVGVGTMIHDFDSDGVSLATQMLQAQPRFGLHLVGPLSLRVGASYGRFFRTRRDLHFAAGTVGLHVDLWSRPRGALWVEGDVGIFFPGSVVEPGFDVGVGYAFRVTSQLDVGPYVRFTHVWNGRQGYGTFELPYVAQPTQDTDSIHWWTVGVSFSVHAPPRPRRDDEREHPANPAPTPAQPATPRVPER